MTAPQGTHPLERSTPSPRRREPLLGGSPAPAGSLFVLGEHGGYAASPRAAHLIQVLLDSAALVSPNPRLLDGGQPHEPRPE